MFYKDKGNLPYMDLRMGVKFYFYENPINCKNEIKEIFHKYCSITNNDFLYYRHNTDMGFKRVKKDYIGFFNKIIDNSTFELTEHIILSNATNEQLQSIKCEMLMVNYHPAYPIRLPNDMYFEFLPTIKYEEIFAFICFACSKIKMHYCCGNPLFGVNDHYPNKSNSCAVKQIKECICLTDKYSVWDNPVFRGKLENGIDGPNAIQILSEGLYKVIGKEKMLNEYEHYSIYCEDNEDYILTAISKEKIPEYDDEFKDSYIGLSNILRDIVLDINKPQMYWKPDEWLEWKKRFNK